jgi:uracil-DNA glycosylase
MILKHKNENIKILEASHPSPLSAHISFNGCGHFTKINEILESKNQVVIEW